VARQRGSFRGRPQTIPKGRGWEAGPGVDPTDTSPIDVFLTSGVNTIVGSGLQPTTAEITLLRLRGGGYVGALDAASLGAGVAAIGVGIVSLEAFNIGATAIPSPLKQAEWDGWLWHMFVPLRLDLSSVDVNQDLGQTFHRFEIDGKAMRKFSPNMVLFVGAEFDGATGVSARVHFMTRALVQWAGA